MIHFRSRDKLIKSMGQMIADLLYEYTTFSMMALRFICVEITSYAEDIWLNSSKHLKRM